ncbi:flagellar motor stator protein MotA [Polynucleobacter sp. 30F-ANTBAC]|jgi:chemotaxis protein MotA|uniref:flagellar motor stator protein MotA n=1 Tax=Polynucleobacter sp. 30F-ANTBAC TaxID=2689095 RepID=UPI001C0D1667|nr:flagellar motor stator protein MotA [Polynucleobacter sp. 30F-ANTBAC]MBU3599748.1 flagellar motor stator protein MotA [Polynucleobacter sp. 30F-ANTBAC]
MNLTIGWIIAIFSVIGGYVGVSLHGSTEPISFYAVGNSLFHLWQPFEYLIIIGASFGAMIASNKKRVLSKIWLAVRNIFKPNKINKESNVELLCLMFELTQKIKRNGLMSLESDIEEPQTSPIFNRYPTVRDDQKMIDFITDYLRMMLAGSMDLVQFESLMEQEIDVLHDEASTPAVAVHTMADGLPAFGIVAAIMGVVISMQYINDPSVGEKIAAAMVGTFLGVLLSYAIVSPVAKVLEHNAEVEIRPYSAVKAILLAHLNNFPPSAAVEFGRKVLFSDQRPSFEELEEGTREVVRAK